MIDLHPLTKNMLIRMYDPEELQRVMETIVLFFANKRYYLEEEQQGHAFMVLDFNDTHIMDTEIPGPTEKYIWN